MSRKAFLISVDFDVHAVTCPGVWLCPKGVVVLRVAMFGLCENSRSLYPCFPLLFHERFRFRRLLKSVSSLTCLQEVLKYRNLHMQLVHLANGPACCPATVLATFRSPLVDVFYPSPNDRGLNVGVDVDLLLKPASAFPGIISPKAEISTRVVIEEVINYPSPHEDSWIVNPVTISSKKGDVCKSDESLVNRQRPVCHTKGINNTDGSHICCCYNLKKPCCCGKPDANKQQKPPFLTGKMRICGKPGSMHDKVDKLKCCKPNKRVRTKIQDYSSDEIFNEQTIKERSQPCNCYTLKTTDSTSICDCILCKKYNDYFQGKNDVISTSANSYFCCTDPCKKGKSTVKTKKKKPCLKKRSPLKMREQKNKVSGDIKEVSKTALPKSIVKQVSAIPKSSLPDDCQCCERIAVPEMKLDQLRKNVGINTECPCKKKYDELSERGKLESCDCKCGIISCPQLPQTNTYSPSRMNQDILSKMYMNKSISILPQNKSHRQIFYSSLEEYYKKLYDRARERSAIEEVQACA